VAWRVGRAAVAASMRFVDIGANLTDLMYEGIYNGTSRHPPDLQVKASSLFQGFIFWPVKQNYY
jgi:hypothetical protein